MRLGIDMTMLGRLKKPGAGCVPCASNTRLPSFNLGAYFVGEAFSIDATIYADGPGAPYTGGTRSTHELWVTTSGQSADSGYKAATVTQLVTASSTVTFTGTVNSNWLRGGTNAVDVDIYVRTYDDCNGTYEEDFGATQVFDLTYGLTHYWPLSETTGTRTDEVGDANMDPINTPGYTATTPWGGNAATFNNANDQYLKGTSGTYSMNLPPSGQKRTFNFWWKSSNVPSSARHITGQWTSSAAEQSWAFVMFNDGTPYSTHVYGSSINSNWTESGLDNDTWHMTTLEFDGTARTATIYIDDQGGATGAASTAGGPDNGYTLTIGAVEGLAATQAMTGAVGLYGVWSRALTDSERLKLYNSGAGLPYPFTG